MTAVSILLLLTSCVLAAASWPGRSYVEVRGYTYNSKSGLAAKDSNSPSQDIIRKGKLSSTVTNKAGALLSPAQVERLIQAITGEHAKHFSARCFKPHHAFVFYDTAGKPVAWVEVCFECQNLEMSPHDPGHSYEDMDALYDLCEELKLPLSP
jgi:hypothetical protein